jgi:predicted DNA-binding protein (UPF0251 family)
METIVTSKRIYRGRAEWDEAVRQFNTSGLSQAEFCRQQSLSQQMFSRALARSRRESSGFARLLTPKQQDVTVVEIPGGVRLNLRVVDPIALIRGLMR